MTSTAARPRGPRHRQALRSRRRPGRRRPEALRRRGARRHRRQRRRQVDADQVPVRSDDSRRGQMLVDGRAVSFKTTQEAREAGIETVYQTLAVAPALDIASNLFLGPRDPQAGSARIDLPHARRRGDASGTPRSEIDKLGISTLQNISQAVETLSGGQRQAVAVARAGAFGSKVVILDEPTAALGVRETGQVLRLVKDLRDRGLGIILISHNMPNVFEVADRIHIQRLGRGAGVITPKSHTPAEAVAIMTGAVKLEPKEGDEVPQLA